MEIMIILVLVLLAYILGLVTGVMLAKPHIGR
jgi:hypothetical protein